MLVVADGVIKSGLGICVTPSAAAKARAYVIALCVLCCMLRIAWCVLCVVGCVLRIVSCVFLVTDLLVLQRNRVPVVDKARASGSRRRDLFLFCSAFYGMTRPDP